MADSNSIFVVAGNDSVGWHPIQNRYITKEEYDPISADTYDVPDEGAIDDALRAAGLADLSPLPRRDIPTLAWVDRFTDAELLAADAIPVFRVMLLRAVAAHDIDVLNPRTIIGVDALIAGGAIDPARKADILRRGE